MSGLFAGDRRSDIWVMQTHKAGSWGSPNSGSSPAELTLGPLGPPASVWRPGIVRSCNALGAGAGSCWLCDSKRSACRASLTPATHTAPHTSRTACHCTHARTETPTRTPNTCSPLATTGVRCTSGLNAAAGSAALDRRRTGERAALGLAGGLGRGGGERRGEPRSRRMAVDPSFP